jgi:hypothetical protein
VRSHAAALLRGAEAAEAEAVPAGRRVMRAAEAVAAEEEALAQREHARSTCTRQCEAAMQVRV